MINLNHSQGPWQVLEPEVHKPYLRIRGVNLGGRYKIANVLSSSGSEVSDNEKEEVEANARLIAVAPEMLEAIIGHCQNKSIVDLPIPFIRVLEKATNKRIEDLIRS